MFRLDLGKYSTNGGSLSPSLAAILYQTSLGDFVYQTDSNGNVVLDNQGTLTSTNDGLLYSGRGIELGALNDVSIPIHHTLGDDKVINGTFDVDTGWNKGIGWSISAGVASSDGTQITVSDLTRSCSMVSGETYFFYIEASISAGSISFVIYDGASGSSTFFTTSSTHTFEYTAVRTGDTIGVRASSDFVGSVDNYSIRQITTENSYLTYYDFTDGLVTVDNSLNTPSTKYTLNSKTVNNILTHTTPWSESDWAKINNNPNLIGKLALETLGATKTIPELDMVMDAGASADKWFMCAEPTLATLYNARSTDSVTIANYAETVRTNADLQQKGIQTTAFVTDTAGMPTAHSSNLLQFNGDRRYIDTKWIPDITKSFTIEAVVPLTTTSNFYNAYLDNSTGTASDNVRIWSSGNGSRIIYNIGNSGVLRQTAVLPSGLYHVVSIWNADTGLASAYVSNIFEQEYATTLTQGAVSMLSGRIVTTPGSEVENAVSLPKIHIGKAFTATEVSTAYVKAKTIYPTIV